MSRMTPPDYRERAKIETELGKNLLVEAGAGSGKTASLVKRMLGLIKEGHCKVHEIAAITFTRKAAAELCERFQTELEKAYNLNCDTVQKERLAQALLDLDQCYIGTIHAFCAKLLRERPVEAGLDPEFAELDEVENRIWRDKAWDSYILEVKIKEPYYLELFDKLGISLAELKTGFEKLSAYPDVAIVYQKTGKPDLKEPIDRLVSLVERARVAIPYPPHENRYDKLQEAVKRASRYIKYFDMAQDKNAIKLLSIFEKEPSVTQKLWLTTAQGKQFRDEFALLAREIIQPLLRQWREYCHGNVVQFLLPAVQYYSRFREKHSVLNFEDLLMKTAQLLKSYPEVRQYFQQKYRCLLVDEFQDTDPIQSEIMFYLTGENANEQEWQKLKPRPGSLFVVGDPKQSIYRFRRADIDIYNLVKKLILQSGGEVLHLTANFRSVNSLGRWLNPVFKKLLPSEGSCYQASFTSFDTIKPDEEGTESGIRVLDIPEEYSNKDEVIPIEAEFIARYIRWAIDGNVRLRRTPRPKDFMILLRYKEAMDVYARALEKYGIPVSIAGGSSLKQTEEIHELLQLLKALADPQNQVHTVAVLRGLFFGISDADLYSFKEAGGIFNIFAPVPAELDERVKDIFFYSYEKLTEFYGFTRRYTPAVALEKIIDELGLIPYALTQPLSKSRSGYPYQILEYIRRIESTEASSYSKMVEQFGAILEMGVEEELNLLADEGDSVRIMNLHKAKGLEAPVVFLANPAKNPNIPPDAHVKRVDGSSQGYFIFTRPKGNFNKEVIAQPRLWDEFASEEQNYADAEEMRLLYVAATRAKNLLVVSRCLNPKKQNLNPWLPLLDNEEQVESLWLPEIDKGYSIVQSLGKEDVIPSHLEKVQTELTQRTAVLAKPSFILSSPTGIKVDEDKAQILRKSGGGQDWGSAIHKVLEQMIKGCNDIDTQILLTLEEYSLPLERKGEILDFLDKFKNSLLWQRIQKAEQTLTEIPFTTKITNDSPVYSYLKAKNNEPVVLSGVIDLAIKESEGWVIVDFKTDRPENQEDFQLLEKEYSTQVAIYCNVWQQLSGENVKKGEIYFTFLQENRVVYSC
ncbi:AAA family ATPase [Thermanaerosceptrum fracticalcis]|uniref:DNA 3'-5' helicase n=1 Tax=Thermanaerosceptrum fracticalcis TaxID=1712410 RepID=A0A7G6E082_THEFR|nr:UvrD-helicase domain-containing protein [Thermanaerosceptrum fracticalcis]QNB45486.1 AAA family ATPase [Thermanaerosceptrum fracticalcis]